ncbi:hypothetical protein [Pelotalea chapellei]|uniref:Outer membrane beta-barrel porin/alpha-amylase n=1 Tax=Pelotalea chapellei TaxID=44671 RepID=A0ABS5U9A1_9BACT|nr:hypothetical protein [Pelotalea chapellei]MBT1072247.1 hypothetical protein [Pelotalea chapellei]
MDIRKILAAAGMIMTLSCGTALATPSTQIWIPSPDVKGFKDVHIDVDNYMRLSPKADAGPNYYNLGVSAGVLPFENVKLEVGADMIVSGFQNDNQADNHPFYFNAKLGTPEDGFGIKGLPAFAVGAFNLGTYDRPDKGLSTRQNIVYGLVGKTFPVIGRLSAGGYHGSSRALATPGNPSGTDNNNGILASWDRSMPEISDKLWLAVDYMSGNNYNGEISVGGSWAFSKQASLLVGVVFFNPFYNISAADNGALPGGKPALTTQLDISF